MTSLHLLIGLFDNYRDWLSAVCVSLRPGSSHGKNEMSLSPFLHFARAKSLLAGYALTSACAVNTKYVFAVSVTQVNAFQTTYLIFVHRFTFLCKIYKVDRLALYNLCYSTQGFYWLVFMFYLELFIFQSERVDFLCPCA